jgi:cobalamin biosynthesis Mg chelatase CobN
LTLAFGQATSSPSPAAQQSPSAQQTPSAQPSQSQPGQQTPKSGDTSVSGSASGQNSASSPNANRSATDQSAQPGQQQPSRAANTGGGLPWGWIIIGIVAVVILIALATRGSDRVDRTTNVERHDDDIRRVG